MKIKKGFNLIIVFIMALAAAAVFVTSFLTTIYYDMNVDVDFPHYKKETITHLIISMAVVFAVFWFLNMKKLFEKNRTFLILALGFCCFYCLFLILSIKPQPVDDSKLLDEVIGQFAKGDYSAITDPSGYLYIWPFQLGYVMFGQIMQGIFGAGNYFAWDIVQMISILLTVLFLYLITWELFGDRIICSVMAFMSLGMLFFYNYVTFIYGDILSMAPQTIALYLTVLYLKKEKTGFGLLAALFIGLAVVLKTNCEITLIAMVMLIILSSFKDGGNYEAYELPKRFLGRIVLSAVIIAFVFGCKWAVDGYYCRLIGIDSVPSGSPAVSHIAMGLQESELEDGWYNGYNYQVFAENGYDSEATKTAAIENIKESISRFIDNPGYAAKFFARKFLTQWADPVCVSTHNLDLVSRHVENPTKMMYHVVFGEGLIIGRWIMNVFMSVCYLCVLIYLLRALVQKKTDVPQMLFLILIFGGMLFHEFWEGSSRYAMRYYVYWLPFAASGMKTVITGFVRKTDRK